jgi:hypothetical protein
VFRPLQGTCRRVNALFSLRSFTKISPIRSNSTLPIVTPDWMIGLGDPDTSVGKQLNTWTRYHPVLKSYQMLLIHPILVMEN